MDFYTLKENAQLELQKEGEVGRGREKGAVSEETVSELVQK